MLGKVGELMDHDVRLCDSHCVRQGFSVENIDHEGNYAQCLQVSRLLWRSRCSNNPPAVSKKQLAQDFTDGTACTRDKGIPTRC